MAASFDTAVRVLLSIEGEGCSVPNDYGGTTKYGITKRQYPNLNILKLTVKQATEIYMRDYWLRYRLNEVVDQEIATQLLLAYVNINPVSVTTCLQRAINACGGRVVQDGIMGSKTLDALNCVFFDWLSDRLRLELIKFYAHRATVDKTQLQFLLGWIRRATL